MKKSTKLIVALLVVVAALAVTYRLMHRVPSADLEANAQMQQIITDAGCLRCHTSTPDLPFYASMPVAGKIVMEDVSKAYRAFDMTQMEADLEAGQPLNPADLAKIEKVILDGKMPQAKYYLVHWGASFNDAKKEVALNWVICCIMTHVYLLTIPYHVPVATGWIQAAWTTNNIPKV